MKYYHIVNVFQLTVFGSLIFSLLYFLTAKFDPTLQLFPTVFDWDLPTISLLVSVIGTFSTLIFRWRADVRNTKRMEQRSQDMEARLQYLESQLELIKTKLV